MKNKLNRYLMSIAQGRVDTIILLMLSSVQSVDIKLAIVDTRFSY